MPGPSDIRLAASLTIVGCGDCLCGSITIRLHDRTGAIFAAAQMPPETAASVVEMIQEELAERPKGLARVRCEGSA